MSDVIVQLPLDRTGRAPNNLIGSEEHLLTVIPGFPYKIITLEHGGFYVKSLRVYDAAYKKLKIDEDYIVTYMYKNAGESVGQEICGAILFLNPLRTGTVFTSAQMVGGDLAFSFTCIEDYVAFFRTKPINYLPFSKDYVGNEPLWKPGELEKERWHLDTYQPFNNEIEKIAVTVEGGDGVEENDFRTKVDNDYLAFLARFNDRLDRHIADKANPHVDTKANRLIDLAKVENLKVATDAEAIAGTSHSLYMTPYLTSLSLDEWALKPLRAHINNKNNPHLITIAQTNANSYLTVDNLAASKYGIQEQVSGTSYADWNGNYWTFDQLYNNIRAAIPAGNFAVGGVNGYVSPLRLGAGSPNGAKVLMSNGIWTDFNALTQIYIDQGFPQLYIINGTYGLQQWQAHNMVLANGWAWTTPVGSIALYQLEYRQEWGTGNGSVVGVWANVYGSIKTAAGWVMM